MKLLIMRAFMFLSNLYYKIVYFNVNKRMLQISYVGCMCTVRARCTVVVEALCYTPEVWWFHSR
jgi:hypothetical protein